MVGKFSFYPKTFNSAKVRSPKVMLVAIPNATVNCYLYMIMYNLILLYFIGNGTFSFSCHPSYDFTSSRDLQKIGKRTADLRRNKLATVSMYCLEL